MTGESINKKNDLKLHCVNYVYNILFNRKMNECIHANMSYGGLAYHIMFSWGNAWWSYGSWIYNYLCNQYPVSNGNVVGMIRQMTHSFFNIIDVNSP